MQELFRRVANKISYAVGTSWAFVIALAAIIMWGVSGPIFKFSDTWQLVINTTTTIITFLMVFLIQNTQNRDSKAVHLKLDELIRAAHGARNNLVEAEDLSDDDLKRLEAEYHTIHERYHSEVRRRSSHKRPRKK